MPQIQTVGNPGSWVMKLRENCFYSPAASVLSVVLGLIILAVVGYVFDWGIANAVWDPNPAACREASGACWGFVAESGVSLFLADSPMNCSGVRGWQL